jgi:hypothetical protein
MTHEQSNRESQEADKIRAAMKEQSEANVTKAVQDMQNGPTSGWYGKANDAVKDFAEWGNEIGGMVKEGPAGQAFDSARHSMADINRRVFEEPWFGKPVADILFERQQGTVHGKVEDQTVTKEESKQQEQGTVHGEQKQEQGKDSFWEEFFGKQQAAEQDRGHDQGLER